jgi:putative ABC transport system ATP-binding protein
MTAISTQSLVKHYGKGKKEVSGLAGVDLTVGKGVYLALVGPSGSGKTTLLLSLGGLIRPTTGKVMVDGTSLYDLKPAERIELRRSKIGFLFQTFNLIPYLTAMENTQVPLMIAGKGRDEQQAIAQRTLERVGLGDRLDHKPSELSIGQQQRVALARTLANSPSIILADEPTGNLDPETADNVAEMLKQLNGEGITIVMVTHDPRMAARAGRVMRLVEGRIAGEGQNGSSH